MTVYYGIDLGTSNCSISYIAGSPRTENNPFLEPATVRVTTPSANEATGSQYRMPSVLYIKQNRDDVENLVGFDALDRALANQGRPYEDLFLSAKSDIGSFRIYEDSICKAVLTPVDVTSEIIRALIRTAIAETGVSPTDAPAVITVPASFMHAQRQATLAAARKAGLNLQDGDLLDEPVAAFLSASTHQKFDALLSLHEPRNVLIFDLGAGTCDISLFTASYASGQQETGIGLNIHNSAIGNYLKLGGDTIDHWIVEQELLPEVCNVSGLDFTDLLERTKMELRMRLKSIARRLKENMCSKIARRAHECTCKWSIDSFSITGCDRTLGPVKGELTYHRFKRLMEPFLETSGEEPLAIFNDYRVISFFQPVLDTLDRADMQPEALDAIILNGGSCHNPLIGEAFRAWKRVRNAVIFETPDVDLAVAKGAALHCYYRYHTGTSLLRPIANDDIGLVTYGNKRERLIAAGTPLPFPPVGEHVFDGFVIPGNEMSSVGIVLYAGEHEAHVISTLQLTLPEGVDKGEQVSLGIQLNENKILTIRAWLTRQPDSLISCTLEQPWTQRLDHEINSSAENLWKEIYARKCSGEDVPGDMMIRAASYERIRKNRSGVLDILQRLADKQPLNATGLNLMALAYDDARLRDRALEYFRNAAEKAPDNIVILSNYGASLSDMGQHDKAVTVLRQAADKYPHDYRPYYWLGVAYRNSGNHDASEREYRQAREILRKRCATPNHDDYELSILEDCCRAVGDYAEAALVQSRRHDNALKKLYGMNPAHLLAGPESGIWTEEELAGN